MTRRHLRELPRADRRRVVVVVLLFTCAWLLDLARDAARLHDATPILYAAVFSFIVAAIQTIAGWLATGATIAASYLATVVAWLAGRIATFILATGSVFAKIWEGVRVVWRDVLKPALVWIDKGIRRLHDFLQHTFKPIIKWLATTRARLLDIYRRFVRPVLDTIDFIHQINQALHVFHLHFLDGLDRVLQQIQAYINEQFARVLRVLNTVQDVIDRIVDLDGFFQRYTLIASMRKYSAPWINGFWNRQIDPTVRAGDDYARGRDYPLDEPQANGVELGRFYHGDASRMDADIAALLPIWRVAAGIDPPGAA